MNVAIVGIGALGSLLGARLQAACKPVLIGRWQAQINAVQANGLVIESPGRDSVIVNLQITGKPSFLAPQDIVIIAAKSHQTRYAAETASSLLHSNGLAITLQNGLNNLTVLEEVVGPAHATLGVTALGAYILEPGRVFHAGEGPTILGRRPNLGVRAMELLDELATCFNLAGMEVAVMDDVDRLVWMKLAVNAAINPLTALLEVTNGTLVESENSRRLMTLAAEEVAKVANAEGVAILPEEAVERAFTVVQATADNRSSMLQDIQRGAPTEIDAISGQVVKIGQMHSIKTPVNALLWTLVRQKQDGAIVADWETQLANLV